jgi:hypothetical protein
MSLSERFAKMKAAKPSGNNIAASGKRNRQVAQRVATTAKRASVAQAKRGIAGSAPKSGAGGKKGGKPVVKKGLAKGRRGGDKGIIRIVHETDILKYS